jgi:site-specific DNA-methyltransferase (adenine-specific)
MKPTEIIGDCHLWLGDCREVLPHLPKVDLVLTDPPYGIGADSHAGKAENGWTQWETSGWDKSRPEKDCFGLLMQQGKHVIVWGGNYFTDYLPPTMQWLVWDKGQRDFSLADCEFAWSSQNKAARVFDYARAKAMQDGKEHPTQKPIALMEWCIDLVKKNDTVADPFMGSGTTGVACANMGKTFYGIEREPKYFDIACKRIEAAYAQGRLFA